MSAAEQTINDYNSVLSSFTHLHKGLAFNHNPHRPCFWCVDFSAAFHWAFSAELYPVWPPRK